MILLWVLVFIVSLALMIKAADYFTKYAEKLGTMFKMSPFLIGVLIIAVGTSLPELVTSIFGVANGQAEFLPSNVMGTVIVNILLGLGIAALFAKKVIKFNWDTVANDMPFMVGAALLLGFALIDGKVVFWENILLIAGFLIYIFYSFQIFRLKKAEDRKDITKEVKEEVKEDTKNIDRDLKGNSKKPIKKSRKTLKLLLYSAGSLIVVIVTGHYLVDALIEIATHFGIGSSVLAGSAVAIGTSLPEIMVAISAVRRNNFDMVLGNIMGSNIFDIFIIFGIPGLFTEIKVSTESLYLFLPFLGISVLIMWLVTIDKKITKAEGLFLILLYLAFLGKLFNLF